MANLLRTVTRLARSPQGRQALAKAKSAASDPKNKEKAAELLDKAKAAVGSKKAGPPPAPPAAPPPAQP